MKKRVICAAVLLAMLLSFFSVADAAKKIPVESISLSNTEAMLSVGKTLKLKTTVLPKKATETKLEWSSSDEKVATVSKGKVKGIAPGKATITVKAASGVSASIEVTVVVPVSKITVKDPNPELAPGATLEQVVQIEPENASVRTINWKSSNRKVAVVDETGAITAVKKGKCTVTGTAGDDSGVTVTVKVKVLDLPEVRREDKGTDIERENISIPESIYEETKSETAVGKAVVLPWEPGEANNMEIKNSSWITTQGTGNVCPVFRRRFAVEKPVKRAELQITTLGTYEAVMNGTRISDYVLAPGWTSYEHRLQVQKYDVTELLTKDNDLRVTVGSGWYRSPMPFSFSMSEKDIKKIRERPVGLIAVLTLSFEDGSEERIFTDENWETGESPVRFSEIYDGETYDARFVTTDWKPASSLEKSKDILIPQEGEMIRETERIQAKRVFRTSAGELVVDFGQEVTGYVEFSVEAKEGETVLFNHGEILTNKGNFYNANYRGAKAEVRYTCREGWQTWHPGLTFFGFRYIHLIEWPGKNPQPEQFTAIVVHSDMQRTGWLESGHEKLNQLFSNIVWSQRGNFLDIPSDCPQRDERLGWTGDAQVFIRSASYLYDVDVFFRKWLRDMAADQHKDGGIPQVVPDLIAGAGGAAWGDAATICPWQLYQTYGDKTVLEEQYECMKRWVDYITQTTKTPDLWIGSGQLGDWLGLDGAKGTNRGASREDFIASAFYAHSTELLVKSGKVLGKDVSTYEALHGRIVAAFRTKYPKYQTQTEYALAIEFGLAEDPQKSADALAKMVKADGKQLRTGFVGTPYILHALSNYGHADLAWDLLLREEYPGWLYSVTKGATTIWEHWDGLKEDGSFWYPEMNSFNHYAYGSVADWVFEQAAGIRHDEEHPGFSEIIWQPNPDKRVGWLTVTLNTRNGMIRASWRYDGERIRYELITPVPAEIRLNGKTQLVQPGSYIFWGEAPGEKKK